MSYMDERKSEQEEILRICHESASKLMELSCSVQIFVTKHEDGTGSMIHGSGNWYARYGQIKEWVIENEQRMKLAVEDE